ncbi:MAG: hypothetical protein GKC10_05125, partial [Methanosarcinales archaeon]|nr:hypothetical protein [Methanosarcinales archaeon]
ELYEDEFNESLFELANEVAGLYEAQLVDKWVGSYAINRQAEQLIEQHFAPLARETEAKIGDLAAELGQRDLSSLTDGEIDSIADRYGPSVQLNPSFEDFFKKIFKAAKKVAKKAVNLAKKGISVAAKLGVGPILNKLKALVKPLLKRVINFAIGKLPAWAQPMATKLSERLPFLKEFDEIYELESGIAPSLDITEIQQEFDQQIANLLFAPDVVEQELEVAQILTEAQTASDSSLDELRSARDEFVEGISQLKEGEDPTPYMEQFVPAILPALRLGIRLVGRPKVVKFLANYLSKYFIKKIVGPKNGPLLSQAIVDTGLRLINLETGPEQEARAASSAVAATVEETVRLVSALPDYVLDNQELLEGFTLEAFEKAAAANLPPILREDHYRKRPDLREAKTVRGVWIPLPMRSRRRRYKKYSSTIETRITPQKASVIQTFGGVPLAEFLEEQLYMEAPGDDVEARVHLFESMPETMLSDLARAEENTLGLGSPEAYTQLHPLTPEAAGLLLGEPGLGREVDPRYLANPYSTDVGQRFYYLEPLERRGKRLVKRPLMTVEPGGRARMRRQTKVNVVLDFTNNKIRIGLYMSEKRAQSIAVKLSEGAHMGQVAAHLGRLLDRGMRGALMNGFGLKIVHGTVTPAQWLVALRRLPNNATKVLEQRLQEWVLKGLFEYLKLHRQEFIDASKDPADGVTISITIANPSGFVELRQALKGKALSLAKLSEGNPVVTISTAPGYKT